MPGQVYQQAEIEYGRFQRRIALDRDLDAAAAQPSTQRGCSPDRPSTRSPCSCRLGRRHRRARDGMSDPASDRLTLPVLPLKETVVFPESMTPLAVGQERSVR